MELSAAREIKAQVLRSARSALAEGDRYRPPIGPTDGAFAIGLFAAGDGTYGVAVRYAGRMSALGEAAIAQTRELAGDDCDIRGIGAVHALQWEPDELQQRVRPLRPGLSVAHAGVTAGTVGAFVSADDRVHVLSNNHVLANSDQAAPGEVILQPGPADGGQLATDRIGILDRVVTMQRNAPNLVDAATALLDDDLDIEPAHPSGVLTGWNEPDVDVEVEKVGRTTGLTNGRITAIEVDGLTVQYPVGVIAFDGQIEVSGDTAFSAGGDSGSVVYTTAATEAVGLLFAGSEMGGPNGTGLTYCNPIGDVLEKLDVALMTEVSQDAARSAKEELAASLAADPRVSGVGITRERGRYAVRVNLVDETDRPELPRSIRGVAVYVVAVGRITPRA